MSRAFASASAGSSASLTPPALPRPPVSTWALTTTGPADLLGSRARLLGRRREAAFGHGDAEAREELLALVFVEIHRRGTLPRATARARQSRRLRSPHV